MGCSARRRRTCRNEASGVTVVSRRDSLATSLARVAMDVVYLDTSQAAAA